MIPYKCPFLWRDLDRHLIHGSLDAHESAPQNGIVIGSAIFAPLTQHTDTDHAMCDICSNRLDLSMHCMQAIQPKNM